MENKEWEDQLRDLLGEYTAPDTHSALGQDANDLNTSQKDPDSTDNQSQGWKRIEASLDAAEQAFDETIRQKVKHYHPTYDPHSWTVFLNRLSDTRYLKSKLIVLKTVEVAIVLLLLLSAYNIEQLGKLPFDSKPSNSTEQHQLQTLNTHEHNQVIQKQTPANAYANPSNQDFAQLVHPENSLDQKQSSRLAGHNTANKNFAVSESAPTESYIHILTSPINEENGVKADNTFAAEAINNSQNSSQQSLNNLSPTAEIPSITINGLALTAEPTNIPQLTPAYDTYFTEPLASVDAQIEHVAAASVPAFEYIKPVARPYTEFSVLAQVDYNALKMPEDRLYSSGREIVFPSKGIMSPGFGAGFTIAIGHEVWALETGVIYNAKNFEPGRQLVVGSAFDNGLVEFEAMKMQIVSLPVQYRYRFDHEGRFKTYGIAGGGFHVIAQSDVDVQIKYHFASLAFGQNPNHDPSLAETIKESRRIREHIRDGAPFSTKSFVSINAGLGFEYMLSEHKAIFFQTVAQYQIPNIAFSNNNGKQLRSISLQAGIRGPLGK